MTSVKAAATQSQEVKSSFSNVTHVAVWEVIGYYYLKTRQTLQSKILARSTPLVGPNLKGTNFYYGDFNARYFFVNVYRFIQAIFSQLQYFPRFISGLFESPLIHSAPLLSIFILRLYFKENFEHISMFIFLQIVTTPVESQFLSHENFYVAWWSQRQ